MRTTELIISLGFLRNRIIPGFTLDSLMSELLSQMLKGNRGEL